MHQTMTMSTGPHPNFPGTMTLDPLGRPIMTNHHSPIIGHDPHTGEPITATPVRTIRTSLGPTITLSRQIESIIPHSTGMYPNVTHRPVDALTGQIVDPITGQPVDPMTGRTLNSYSTVTRSPVRRTTTTIQQPNPATVIQHSPTRIMHTNNP